MDDMLSLEAIKWLKSINYANRTHEERMILIRAAKILFPE